MVLGGLRRVDAVAEQHVEGDEVGLDGSVVV